MAVDIITEPRTDLNWSKNDMPVVLHTDIDPVIYNVVIKIGVIVYVGELAGIEFFDEQVVDVDGIANFEISGLVDEAIRNLFTAPDATVENMSEVLNAPISVTVNYYEYKDGVLETAGDLASLSSGFPYRVLKGGVSNQFIDKFDEICDMFSYQESPADIKFLTWLPKRRIVDKNQSCPLYYMNTGEAAALNVKIRVYAGATEIIGTPPDIFYNLPGVWNIYKFNAGWKNLSIDAIIDGDPNEDNVTHWTVQLVDDDDTPFSELITFYLDPDYKKNNTYLVFQNSLNGFDDIRLTGEILNKGSFARSVSVMSDIVNRNDGTRTTFEVIEAPGKKINTGYLSPKECDALRELLMSARVFEIFDDGRQLPIEFTEATKDLVRSNDYLNGAALEFIYTTANRAYTPQPEER